jgi:ribosomal protein S8
MEKLFNILNVGYMTNSPEIKVVFKKKYLFVLEKLLKINCIDSYTFDKNFIIVRLRYYKNKPLFFFSMRSKAGNKIYKKISNDISQFSHSHFSLFFTNKGLLTFQEAVFKNVGGEHVVDILFINKKIL